MMEFTGVCPVCQQTGIKTSRVPPDDDSDPGWYDPTVYQALYDHDHQGNQRCDGSGQNPVVITGLCPKGDRK